MGYWYHPEIEEQTIGTLMDYEEENPDARWKIEFSNGETYICDYFTSYQSDNIGELDIDDETTDPRYDEFYEVGFLVTTVIKGGPRQPGPRQYLAINYHDFPTHITNADTGETIYPKP